MIRIIENGNIFDSKMDVIAITVNTIGVAGKGIALEAKKRFPDWYKVYKDMCDMGQMQVGNLSVYCQSNPKILNFPTKTHWKWPSKLEYIEKGLDNLANNGYNLLGIKSLALPALGCTNGGLDWSTVKDLIINKLKDLPIEIEIYAPLSETR